MPDFAVKSDVQKQAKGVTDAQPKRAGYQFVEPLLGAVVEEEEQQSDWEDCEMIIMIH